MISSLGWQAPLSGLTGRGLQQKEENEEEEEEGGNVRSLFSNWSYSDVRGNQVFEPLSWIKK